MSTPPALIARVHARSAPCDLPDTTPTMPGPCRLWLGRLNTKGYGVTYLDGTTYRVHRVLWEAQHGTIPYGMVLDHTCHDETRCRRGDACLHRRCVNPDHLTLATHAENSSRTYRAHRDRTRSG